jgi:predicted RNase H-like HicB family nuclease/DNA-binding XRE family transcriptional regulator
MFYRANVAKSGKHWLVTFPDCEGCLTEANTRTDALEAAHEALEGWLEAHLVQGSAPPRPRARKGDPIEVAPQLSAVLQIRWRREELELTQGQLAKRAGVSQQQIAKLEDPDGNPTVATLEKIAAALGLRLELNFTAA